MAARRSYGRPPGDYRRRDDRRAPSPSPRHDRYPPPNSQQPARDMYQFRGIDQYRPPQRGDSYSSQVQGNVRNRDSNNYDFSFRAGRADGPRFDPTNKPRDLSNPHGKDQRNRYDRPPRGRPARYNQPSDRPLLRSKREATPEQLTGMHDGQARFVGANDISDSEEEAMQMESDAEEETGRIHFTSLDAETALDDNGPQKKRLRLAPAADGDTVPKWSNPDPYTSLPPPGESQAKRKDVVKLIRKAKVMASKSDAATTGANMSDFISFNFDDDESASQSDFSEEAIKTELPVTMSPTVNGNHASLDDRIQVSATAQPGFSSALPDAPSSITVRSQVAGEVLIDRWPPPEPVKAGSKRRFDDALGPLPAPQKSSSKKAKRDTRDGSLLSEWVAKHPGTATPWCTVDHSATEQIGFWLHKEILDFYEYVKPRGYEDQIRLGLVSRIGQFLQRHYPKHEVHCFGSFAAGLYLPTADMDLVVMSPEFAAGGRPVARSNSWIRNLATRFEKDGIAQRGSTETVLAAKVPIVKFVDDVTGLKCDISFENATGVVANGTFEEWKRQFPAMPIIVTLIKQLLLMRGLNEVFTGGLGGFSITCLVTSMMQLHPGLQSGNMNQLQNLGELLLTFLDLYGNNLNTTTTGIQLNPPGHFDKHALNRFRYKHIDRLSIIDPNKSDNDISSGTSNIRVILQCFSDAYAMLQARMGHLQYCDMTARRGSSILGCLFGGNYSSFEWQRDRLRRLHEQSGAISGQERQVSENRAEHGEDSAKHKLENAMIGQEMYGYGNAHPSEIDCGEVIAVEHGGSEPRRPGYHGKDEKEKSGLTLVDSKSRSGACKLLPAIYIAGIHSDEAACSCIASRDVKHVQRLEYMGTHYLVHFKEPHRMYAALTHARSKRLSHHRLTPAELVILPHEESAGSSQPPVRTYEHGDFLKLYRTEAGRAVISKNGQSGSLTATAKGNQPDPPASSVNHQTQAPNPNSNQAKAVAAHVQSTKHGNELSEAEKDAGRARAALFRQKYPEVENVPAMLTEIEESALRSDRARAKSFRHLYPTLVETLNVPNQLKRQEFERFRGMAEKLAAKVQTHDGNYQNQANAGRQSDQRTPSIPAARPPTPPPPTRRYNLQGTVSASEGRPLDQQSVTLQSSHSSEQKPVQRRYDLRSSRVLTKSQWATQESEKAQPAKPQISQTAGTSIDDPMIID